MSRRHWYFVTSQSRFGKEMKLTPRSPIRTAYNEPTVERICVAPTVAGCLSAVPDHEDTVYVYRTKKKTKAQPSYGVPDAKLTKEHWLTKETEFELVDTLNLSKVSWKLGPCGGAEGSSDYLQQRKDKRNIVRFLKRRGMK